MIIETDSDLYFEIRGRWLRGNPLRWLTTLGEQRARSFKKFIEDNGGQINEDRLDKSKIYGGDSVGIIPGITTIVFEDEKLYTMFVLRWT